MFFIFPWCPVIKRNKADGLAAPWTAVALEIEALAQSRHITTEMQREEVHGMGAGEEMQRTHKSAIGGDVRTKTHRTVAGNHGKQIKQRGRY
jgi:hypothetical protein